MIPNSRTDAKFLSLWLENPSWSPISLTSNGWVTAKSKSGKAVPLTEQAIRRAYSPRAIASQIIGKRFGRLTNYLMIDVDRGSQYHPANGSIQSITDALEEIGLVRYIIIRSSYSEGIHVYFPLPCSVSSWSLATAANNALADAGVTVAAGQCETFPNTKSYGSEYNGHRLPLQAGSVVLDEGFTPVSDSKDYFVEQWAIAAGGQDEETLQGCFGNAVLDSAHSLCFTAPGQSNNLMLRLAKEGVKKGLSTVERLGQWVAAEFRALPGYEQFASAQSKRTAEAWGVRVARWALKVKRIRKARKSGNYHNAVADNALARVEQAIAYVFESVVDSAQLSFCKFATAMIEAGKKLTGVGFGWKTLYKYRELILKRIAIQRAKNFLLSNSGSDLVEVWAEEEGKKHTHTSRTSSQCERPPDIALTHLHNLQIVS